MSTLQNFINDFLQSTTDDDPTADVSAAVAPVPPAPPPPPPARAEQKPKKRAREGGDETASERADRKSARERRRRAEVGEKFDELTKALQEAEETCPDAVPRRDAVTEGNRVDLLQRAIDVVRALTKSSIDSKQSAAEAALVAASAPAAPPAPPPPPPPPLPPEEPVRLVVVAQTSCSRGQLADLAKRGDAWHTAFETRDGGSMSTVAGAAATAATSFVVGNGSNALAPGPPTPNGLAPAPAAPLPPVGAFSHSQLPATLSIPYPRGMQPALAGLEAPLEPTQTGRPRAPSGGAASYFAPAAC